MFNHLLLEPKTFLGSADKAESSSFKEDVLLSSSSG